MELLLLEASSAVLLADRQERENKQIREVGKNELVEAKGQKQWQVNTYVRIHVCTCMCACCLVSQERILLIG